MNDKAVIRILNQNLQSKIIKYIVLTVFSKGSELSSQTLRDVMGVSLINYIRSFPGQKPNQIKYSRIGRQKYSLKLLANIFDLPDF